MKKIGLLSIVVMMTLPAIAQVSFDIHTGGAYSLLIQRVENTYETGARFGFSIAGLADTPLSKSKKWPFHPETAFVSQGGAYYPSQDIHGMALNNKYWYYSLQISVNVAYTFTFTDAHLPVFVGPTFDQFLFDEMKSQKTNPDLHFGASKEKDLKPCDFDMNVGLPVKYGNLFSSVSPLYGMIDRCALERNDETSIY